MSEYRKIPFLRLSIPLLFGILAQYYFSIHKVGIILIFISISIMLISFFVKQLNQYRYRWMFGLGVYLFLFSVGVFSTLLQQYQSSMPLLDIHEVYQGTVVDIPQEKPNVIAYKVKLKDQNRDIICYLPKEPATRLLQAGDDISFFSKIEPFKKSPDSDTFDYARYMYNQGFVGFTFVPSDRWEKTQGKSTVNINLLALKCRLSILNFYKSLDLNEDEYALLSGLTLGHKDSFSEELIHTFRATGTGHILAVSGLHVGIIYAVLLFSLSFIRRHSRFFILKQIIVIVLLWAYCFIIGLPPSAVRACIMLSIFSLGEMFGRRGYSYNTIFAAAFFILVWNPFKLFDIGFQLSFVAVLSICFFMSFISNSIKIENKILRYIWNIFCLSLAVQIGVLPLSVYYFGIFPSYFFITNLLIVPIVSFIIYDAIFLFICGGIATIIPSISGIIYFLPLNILKIAVHVMTSIAQFFEKLPLSYFQEIRMSLFQLFCISATIFFFVYFLKSKKPKSLIVALTTVLALIISNILDVYFNQNSLTVHNNTKKADITYQRRFRKEFVDDKNENQLLYLNGQKFFILVNDEFNNKVTSSKMKIDYMQLEGENSVSLYSLKQIFDIERIIIGSSISQKTAKRLILECEKLRIPYYDVSNNGRLRINF